MGALARRASGWRHPEFAGAAPAGDLEVLSAAVIEIRWTFRTVRMANLFLRRLAHPCNAARGSPMLSHTFERMSAQNLLARDVLRSSRFWYLSSCMLAPHDASTRRFD